MELTTREIREQLRRYLTGDLDAAAFRDWFAVVLRDAHKSTDPELEQMAHDIEWALCDLESGSCSVENVTETLRALAGSGPASTAATVLLDRQIIFEGATIFRPLPLDVTWVAGGRWLLAAPADRESAVVFSSEALHQ
jgi:hypothetical protein